MSYFHRILLTCTLVFSLLLALVPSLVQAQATETLLEGHNTNLAGDDSNTQVPIGFDFTFYGNTYSQTFVSTNGFISFGSGSSAYTNTGIPNSNAPNNMIAAFWDDLIVQSGRRTIYYQTVGTAPNRKFIAQWTNMYFYSNPTLQMGTFQIILSEGSNDIQIRYLDLYGSDLSFGSSATVGVENLDGTEGILHSLNQPNLTSGQCFTLSPSDGSYSTNQNPECVLYRLYDPNAPAPAVLLTPNDGVNEESLIPHFSWEPADKATSYTVLVATDANFSNIVYNQTGITDTSFSPPNPLGVEMLYYWRVQSVNSTTTALSDVRTFTTIHAPTISSMGPSSVTNGGYITTSQPTLNFTVSDTIPEHTVEYLIQVDNNSNFNSPEIEYTSAMESTGAKSFSVGQAAGTGAYTFGAEGQELENGNYYWRVQPTDSAGATPPFYTANNGSIAFRILTGSSEISDIAAQADGSDATVTWSTKQVSSSQVEYGRVETYGFSSNVINTSPRVQNHSVQLSHLAPCSKYFYRVKSVNAAGTLETSGQKSFVTPGCVSPVVSGTQKEVSPNTEGTVTHAQDNGSVAITTPENFVNQNSVTIQINQLDDAQAPGSAAEKSLVKNFFYSFTAVSDNGDPVTDFDSPLTIVFHYDESVENTFYEDTLNLFYYDEANEEWQIKPCVLDMSANTLTCTLSSFSTYAIQGNPRMQSASNSQNNSSLLASAGDHNKQCTQQKPGNVPQLFKIDRNRNEATLWITPGGNPYTGFVVWYGEEESTTKHADIFEYSQAQGMVAHTIRDLSPQATYSFRVQAKNDCAFSESSNIVQSRPGSVKKQSSTPAKEHTPIVGEERNQEQAINAVEDTLSADDLASIDQEEAAAESDSTPHTSGFWGWLRNLFP